MNTLVIVESPAKCKKIETYLGPGYKCVASFGHIRELNKKKGLGCINKEDNYKPSFIVSPSKGKQVSKLKQLISVANEVILATDDDREGEAIAWHICVVCKLPIKTTKRIIFHEITKTALQRAVSNPTTINMNKVNAQLARQVLDYLVGFTISPVLWRNISKFKKGSMSAGRCQTPALRIVYDNQNDIDGSPGEEGYEVTGLFTPLNIPFKLSNHISNKEDTITFLEDTVSHDHIFKKFKTKQTTKKSPIPLTTSQIQQKASNVLHYSPKQTMLCCQHLYEAGYITYMRTDSVKYSIDFVNSSRDFIIDEYGEDYVKSEEMLEKISIKKSNTETKTKTKTKTKKKNNAQEAHEAIRPTKITRRHIDAKNKIGSKEVRLYGLIWTHSLESCMANAIYNSMKTTISAPELESLSSEEPDSKTVNEYVYNTEQVVFPGWKIVNGYQETNPIFTLLQDTKTRTTLEYNSVSALFTIKKLKSHYTEAKLVSLLEKRGIGRPSTFSSLISKIQERGYVEKRDVDGKELDCIDFKLVGDEIEEESKRKVVGNEHNKLVITQTGVIVLEFLIKHFDNLFNYDYTRNMEKSLDTISKGRKVWHKLCEECNILMCEQIEDIKDNHETRFEVDENHTYMIGRYGPVLRTRVDGKVKFLKVKPDISVQDIKSGTLSIDDIIVKTNTNNRNLGDYKGSDIYIRKGKYGYYINHNSKNYSLRKMKEERVKTLSKEYCMSVINGTINTNPKVLRILSENLSVRKGKYGNYVFYKTPTMKKPQFLKLKGFDDDPLYCDKIELTEWLFDTYSAR